MTLTVNTCSWQQWTLLKSRHPQVQWHTGIWEGKSVLYMKPIILIFILKEGKMSLIQNFSIFCKKPKFHFHWIDALSRSLKINNMVELKVCNRSQVCNRGWVKLYGKCRIGAQSWNIRVWKGYVFPCVCVYVCVFMRQRKGEILLKGLAHKELLKHLCLISVTDVTRNLELPCTQAWTTLASSLQLGGQDSLFPGPQRVWLDLTTYIFC